MISLPISYSVYLEIAVELVIKGEALLELILQKDDYISKVFIAFEAIIDTVQFPQSFIQ